MVKFQPIVNVQPPIIFPRICTRDAIKHTHISRRIKILMFWKCNAPNTEGKSEYIGDILKYSPKNEGPAPDQFLNVLLLTYSIPP